MDAARGRWAQLVGRWRRSGLTAREFAESAGINAGTLAYWAWRLKREGAAAAAGQVKRGGRRSTAAVAGARFVELRVERHEDGRFLLELGDGRRLRIPAAFDGDALKRLLTALREAPG
jgi:transposase